MWTPRYTGRSSTSPSEAPQTRPHERARSRSEVTKFPSQGPPYSSTSWESSRSRSSNPARTSHDIVVAMPNLPVGVADALCLRSGIIITFDDACGTVKCLSPNRSRERRPSCRGCHRSPDSRSGPRSRGGEARGRHRAPRRSRSRRVFGRGHRRRSHPGCGSR